MNGQMTMDGWMNGQMEGQTDVHKGWTGWVLVLQEVSGAGALRRAGREVGGEHRGDAAICPGAQEVTDYRGWPVLMKQETHLTYLSS